MKKQYRVHIALMACLAVLLGMAGVAFAHPNVTLKDASGTAIPVGGDAAYSPKQTCGGCHDYDSIEQHSYHALIGSNELKGFNPYNPDHPTDKYLSGVATKGKSWVQSPGHVGKW
ncbi:hypothetical protein SAMN02745165_00811 [Malonomonas rubra DSM 5091]|uniref:Cytochrome c domain-containing protein n=1 Tax=Malonomonas rubra DSM 5091 TaxID=1122189 RepID=A0A1M6DUU4_MALRU|nr:hypothetical protein [Malonomonas rubra]SHI76900.1 hypothetical protein SAMN02745165_00811 [Malonomonas rubra DSM 5091]